MAKIRKTASIENGIMQVLKILTEEEIQKAINKSSSYLRKCSNPDLQQQIDHNDSIKLDLACIKKGKAPPLRIAHEYIVNNEIENLSSHKENDIDEMLVKSTILHGKLTEVVKLSEDGSLNNLMSGLISIIHLSALSSFAKPLKLPSQEPCM